MDELNQNSTKSAENVSFQKENLQVTENDTTFAPSQNSRSKLLYYDPMSDFGFKKIFGRETVL